jgi:1-hydroxy-2-isopentenylcarotenoid 3,4-desaturase
MNYCYNCDMNRKAIVIGAGYSGLSMAALLAKDGWQVTVLEKNDEIGGRARLWKTKGFSFDMGPSWYLMPEVFERFFELFDRKREDFFELRRLDPYYKVFFSPEDTALLRPDLNANIELFESFEKGGGNQFRKYVDEATYKYDIAISTFLYREYRKLTDFFDRQVVFEGTKLHIFSKLDKYVRRYFSDRRARQILEYTMVFLGTDPKSAPALYSIMSHVDMQGGVFFPKDGMAGVAEGIAGLCRDLGVTIITGQDVKKITVSGGRASGVETADTSYPADLVVSGADYQHVESDLIDAAHRSYSSSYWNKRVVAPSMFIIYLGLGRKLKNLEHHNLYFQEDWGEHFKTIFEKPAWPQKPCFYLSVISKTDPETAPEGGENIFLLVPTAAGLDDSDDAQREQYYEHVIKHVEEITGEDFHSDILVKRIFSQRDFSGDYHAFKGTALGLSHTLMQTAVFRPAHRSRKISNLYHVGQYTHPGVGVPMALISSEIVAGEIRREFSS